MNLLINLFLVFFVLVALLMVLVILMQRPGRSIWRGSHGKYLWRANHKRVGEVHSLDGWRFFCDHVCVVNPLCP
jgi:hypothetical protein